MGPAPGSEHAEERLPGWERPSVWYLTGFLVPSGTPPADRTDDFDDDDFDAEVPEHLGMAEESAQHGKRAKRGFFPSSMGLSFLVQPGAHSIRVAVTWGDYRRAKREDLHRAVQTSRHDDAAAKLIDRDLPRGHGDGRGSGSDGGRGGGRGDDPAGRGARRTRVWTRTPRAETVDIPLGGPGAHPPRPVPDSGGLFLHAVERPIPTDRLGGQIAPGTKAVSVFLVNNRSVAADSKDADETYAFQVRLSVECDRPFSPRPDLSARRSSEWDERVADLHFSDTPAYATGHGVSADWTVGDNGECRQVRTAWIGESQVEATRPRTVPGVELSMQHLGVLPNGEAAREALLPLIAEYRRWIGARATEAASLPDHHRATADGLLFNAEHAAKRMERGVEALAADPDVLDAFRMANRAVRRVLSRRAGDENPKWHPFQLAFLLLNLNGMADPRSPDRLTVDLLFFPTGGGKTEAYLGLAAFAMVLRRLRSPGDGGRAGAGVSVIMRYTLRLLTLDQLARAAGLVCALELERERDEARYGAWPFEIGLWVGKAATPNRMGRKGDGRRDTARSKTLRYKSNPRANPSPIPIESCPWCGEGFSGDSFELLPNADRPRDLRVVCADFECDFSGDRPLPIVAVDEPLYRRLPAFLIATVDKFASLPWEGPSGALLGGADRYDANGFHGAAAPGHGAPLDAPLLPPDLIVQDELHLITGPLGTMMGLYEAAIDGLCAGGGGAGGAEGGAGVEGGADGADDGAGGAGGAGKAESRGGAGGGPVAATPKIVASTATARSASDQVQAVFARADTRVFPPPGPDRRDSFFARTVPAAELPARRYVGIAAPGRNPKVIMRRALLALMGAAQTRYLRAGGRGNRNNPADPYMTLLAYFNSLRELGGARRIVEEEVQNTLRQRGVRRRLGEERGLFRDRTMRSEVMELTSRVTTAKVAEAFERLGRAFRERGGVDCALATNMISVGLDVSRLGLMVVVGQPKTHAEYIQATSRVGRDPGRPGLVVTLLNIHKARDRSHYERFRHYHETFYRSVEPASVTPFSARALDRGFSGALVALARHSLPALTPPRGAEAVKSVRAALEERLAKVFANRLENQPIADPAEREEAEASVRGRVADLLDSWTAILDDYQASGVRLQYQRHERRGDQPLLRHLLDPELASQTEHHRKFRANRSLRDVEPEVHVYVKDLDEARGSA